MYNMIIKKLSLIVITLVLISCEKEVGPLSDLKPAVPIIISNATDFRPDPTVTTSLSGGGVISITITIPAGIGSQIKEITNIATNTTYSAIQNAGPFYIAAPIVVNGVSYTFNTSIAEYFVKNPVSASNPAAAANVELARRFYFLITLSDNKTIVSQPVRVLVLN